MIPLSSYWALMRAYLVPRRVPMAGLGTLLLAMISLQLISPRLVASFIDGATGGAPRSNLVRTATLFLGLAIAQQLLNIAATLAAERLGWDATNQLRTDLASHLLSLDMGFHKAHTPGELIERIDGDVTALSNFFSRFTIHVAANAVLVIGVIALLFGVNPWMGFGMTLVTVSSLMFMLAVNRWAIPQWQGLRGHSARFYGFLGEQLAGTEDIRSAGAGAYVLRRFSEILREWRPAVVRAGMASAAMWGSNVVVFGAVTTLIFWLGSTLLGSAVLTIGKLYLVFSYAELLRFPLDRIRNELEDLQKAGAAIGRVSELLALRSRLDESGRQQLQAGALSVDFDGVTFSYDDEEARSVLSEVAFSVEPGQVLGVLGRTGSGKTTIARLLTRLYDPMAGQVRLGGVALPAVSMASFRRRVGLVTQDVQLLRASVRANLTFFDDSVPDERIEAVLGELGLGDWLAGLASGLDTDLGEGTAGLSAGEAQLLAFARVFLRDPGLVILDEASSRLDPATEALIEKAVDRLLAGRTAVIIAHRLATLDRADQVLIMEDGRIAELGSRQVLADDPTSRLARYLAAGMEEVLA